MIAGHTPSIAQLRELRKRALQRLAAAVPSAIDALTARKLKLETRVDAGKKLSPPVRKELDEIRALLKRIEQAKICALLNRMDLDEIRAKLLEIRQSCATSPCEPPEVQSTHKLCLPAGSTSDLNCPAD